MYELYSTISAIMLIPLIFSIMWITLEGFNKNSLIIVVISGLIVLSMAINSQFQKIEIKNYVPTSYAIDEKAGKIHYMVNGMTYTTGEMLHYSHPEDTVLEVREVLVGKWVKDLRISGGVLKKKSLSIE